VDFEVFTGFSEPYWVHSPQDGNYKKIVETNQLNCVVSKLQLNRIVHLGYEKNMDSFINKKQTSYTLEKQ
jgi:hypothetical protein